MSVHIQDSPARAYREAGEAKNVDAVMATLSPRISFHSPLTGSTPFEGHDRVREVFAAALGALTEVRYHTDVGDERTRMVAATARLGSQRIEESALLRLDEHGLIEDLTLWIRPLPGLTALMAALGPRLARAGGKPGLAVLVAAATRPLAVMTRLGDRTLVPLLNRP
ncbi:nuclear transport factor 2 family protein [Nonomuraea sp. SMC257]|uniref:Nuclear transport factor 2 family protein n=1 Tax=Nonomuraea montanisoli TaxID=2741721 RepID=A0A7Y6M2B8_9ACTN|nr:nuclear transport factor 2 family protein [Nonomuraea montanisoli]NUW32027.1 nuclear transport factor 2 family protein [Nonomuraea montanisoli]